MFTVGDDQWPGIAKLIEECGEVGQICGKLVAAEGDTEHFDGTNLARRLEEEMGDTLAAIEFVCRHCEHIDRDAVVARAEAKLKTFEKWHLEGS